MTKIYTVLALLGLINFMPLNAAEYSNLRVESCAEDDGNGLYVYSNDFSWGMSLDQIRKKSTEIYESGKRLKERAFHNGADVVFPYEFMGEKQFVKLSPRFIKSVSKHIEVGLERGYIDAVIFPDMGHSHFFIPKKYYNDVLEKFPNEERVKRYEAMINYPDLKILYHTAEQLTMVDENKLPLVDRETQWRFYTRNMVGDNQALGRVELLHNLDSSHNTAHDYDDDHRYWGAGFNVTASKEGCFSYEFKGKKFYFDLSLKDLESSLPYSGDDYGL